MSIANADDLDWRADAACLEHPAETFFPEEGEMAKYYEAGKICGGCSVRSQCLEDALRSKDLYGIRAGLGVKERIKLMQARAGAKAERPEPAHPSCGTESGYMRHRNRREPSCAPCARAVNQKNKERADRRRPASCGADSHAGYVKHQHRKEIACKGCCAAESAYTLARRAARNVTPAA